MPALTEGKERDLESHSPDLDPTKESSDRDDDDSSIDLTRGEYMSLRLRSGAFLVLSGIAYGAQATDKAVTSAGSVMGLRSDLGMHGDMFSWVNISYWIAYVVMTIPFSIFLLEKIGARYFGLILAASGAIVACSGASQNYAGYIATRVILGVLQSTCEPTVAVTIHQWSHGTDHYAWALTWFFWNGVGQVFLQALGYGLYIHSVNNNYTIAGWRIFFIIVGLLVFVYGLIFYGIVPSSPQNAIFLSDRQKAYMRNHHLGRLNRPFRRIDVKFHQIVEAFTYGFHHTALLFVALFANAINGSAVNTFNNLWLKDFIAQAHPHMSSVDSNKESLLYGMISPAIKIVLSLLIAAFTLLGFFRRHRVVYILFFMVIHLIATCLLAYAPTPYVAYGGLFLYNATVEVAHAGMFSVVASNVGGMSKKITVSGLLLIAQGVGGSIGPKIFSNVPKQSNSRKAAMVAMSTLSLVCLAALFLSYYIENKIRDKKGEKTPEGADRLALTDREDKSFRYHL